MKKLKYFIVFALIINAGLQLQAQQANPGQKATLVIKSEQVVEVPSIASQIADGTFKPAENIVKEYNPKKWGKNTSVPGKGLPKGNDPLWDKQTKVTKSPGKAPILTFEAASSGSTPTDPTGAVGPNHFVNSWNSSFRIWDKAGNALTPAASLSTIFPGTLGDPIVMYDRFADRFFISEFFYNGFDVAVSQGPDPVNDGWYVYRFNTNTFPDYPKFNVWSDAYYITANKDQSSPATNEVVFALDRDAMLIGDPTAQMIGFPLTGVVVSGFYSPLGFNCNGPTLPDPGNAPIVYMQDDAWSGVSVDHLKIWNINVDWATPGNSTISTPQQINTAPFDGLFDGGSFVNLPQPSGSDIDALQATIMYMAQYRRFTGYNSVVFNFVVDMNGNDDYAGIRWYELRQNNDGDPWYIHQEGTYSQPGNRSVFSGNMCMDANGNIALAYTTVSTSVYPSLRYTGRYAGDASGTMTMVEEVILNGTQSDPSTRYGDYSQMTIDPTDDATFWSIGEVFNGGTRKNHVGVFQFAPPSLTAIFSGTPTNICSGGNVIFTDQSLGSPTSWNWNFPGGSPGSYSGQFPPAITYALPGTYDVSLTVGDGVDTDIETKTAYITVQNVIADFSGTPKSIVVGNTVSFIDNSSCSPTSWAWTFTGGTPSTFVGQTPPPIQYDVEGIYDVSLTVANALGSDIKTIPGYISVLPPEFNMANGTVTTCNGNFYDSGGPSGGYSSSENLTQTFYPSTPGDMIRLTFNSFATESSYDFLYIYNGENTSAPLIGTYDGSISPGMVTASNASGALTFNFTSDGSVTAEGWSASISCYSISSPPVAEFSASTTNPLANSDVIFTDLSTNIPTFWNWSFSPATVVYVNGTDANSQNPVVQFTELTSYTVTLTATNAYGSDDEAKINYISVIDCSVSTYPYVQNFDGFTISAPDFACTTDGSVLLSECWTNVTGDNIDWDCISVGTGSSGTGPAQDHSGSGNYLYTESSSCYNSIGYLTSPLFDLTSLTNPELRFWYHMWGSAMGALSVQVSVDGGSTWSSNIWSMSGNQGNLWQEAIVSLSSFSSETDLMVRFNGTTGTDFTSDMAIDDFSIVDGYLPGENCTNAQDLSTLTSPYSATTSGYINDFSFCGMGSSPDRIFFMDVPNGYTVEIWQSWNNYNSTHSVRYEGTCPGSTEIGCINDDDYTPISWENLSGSTETVWFIVAGSGSNSGDFTLEWTLTPTAIPTCNGDIDIDGAGITTWNYPLSTYYHDARTTSIYLASEFDCAGGDITAMQYYISTVPGQTMTAFTIRMKHISSDSYSSGIFENVGWTTVYQANDEITSTGWYTFNFTTPFTFNGLDNLEVDVCFNNDSYTTDGNVYFFNGGANRSKYYRCDGCSFPTDDPLTWTNSGTLTTNVPRVLFTFESSVRLNLKAYLEGSYNGTNMDANIVSYLPLSQPFNMPFWNYNGTESVGAIPNSNIVDWVLIDIRDAASAAAATSSTSVAKQAAFILNDGSIVDLDGSSNLELDVSVSQNMYVVVWQRNHLGIMANSAIPSSGGEYTYDFTTGINQVFGGIDGHKEISIGIWGMIGGDGNHDGAVNVNDKSPLWETEAGQKGYISSDHNLDGEANNKDKDDIWEPNENKSSQVPN